MAAYSTVQGLIGPNLEPIGDIYGGPCYLQNEED